MSTRRPLWFRLLRGAFFAAIVLTTLAALGLSWLSFSGRRDWARTKADLLARGEKLSLVELAPTPVPDDQNFFGDPMWKELIPSVTTTSAFGVEERRPEISPSQRQIAPLDANPLPEEKRKEIFARHPRLKSREARSSVVAGLLYLARTSDSPAERTSTLADAKELFSPVVPLLTRIAALAERPEAVSPADYSGPFSSLSYLSPLFNAGRYFAIRANVELLQNDPTAAARDVQNTFNVARAFRSDPFLISLLARLALTGLARDSVRLGIEHHVWNDGNLHQIERELSEIDLVSALPLALRGERGSMNTLFEQIAQRSSEKAGAIRTMEALQPEGFRFPTPLEQTLYSHVFQFHDQVSLNREIQRQVDAINRDAQTGLHPSEFPPFVDSSGPLLPINLISKMTRDNLRSSIINCVRAQSLLVQTRIACALERYWLRHREYPSALAALVPEFLPAIPADVIAGQAFRYRLVDAGHFDLWSVGWNGTDENGVPGKDSPDRESGDWNWANM